MEQMTDEDIDLFCEYFPLTREMVDAGFVPVLQAHWIEWFVCSSPWEQDSRFHDDYEKTQGYNRNSKTRELPEDIYLARNGKWFVSVPGGWAWIKSGWSVSTQVHYELEAQEDDELD